MSTVKRVYFYTVSFITLGMFAAGVGILLSLCFGLIIKGSAEIKVGEPSFVKEQLSLGLAMLVIGGALWFTFWRAVQKQAAGKIAEIGSAIRKFFINLILVVTALVGLYAAAEFLVWLMAGVPREQSPWGQFGTLIVTGAVWYYHWQLAEKEGHPSPEAKTLRRWYVYILSAWGLVTLSVGLIQLVNAAILNLPFWGGDVIQTKFWISGVQRNISWILLGGFS